MTEIERLNKKLEALNARIAKASPKAKDASAKAAALQGVLAKDIQERDTIIRMIAAAKNTGESASPSPGVPPAAPESTAGGINLGVDADNMPKFLQKKP